MNRNVLMAAIVGAQGLKGEVRVKCFARVPQNLGGYGPLHDAGGRPFTLASMRAGTKGEWVAAFAEVRDRTAAEGLKGVKLFANRADLPETPADEFYHTDLIGLKAAGPDGAEVGTVVAVHNFGAGDILEIAGRDGRDILLAFTKDNVPAIDVALGRMTVVEPDEIEAGRP
jgi:16S rRNA processing protein RimM